jgi:hypothetical protein
VAASALGGALHAAHNEEPAASGWASILLVLGGLLFGISLLVEFFTIGSPFRSVAKSSEVTASLLAESRGADRASTVPPPARAA